MSLHAKTIKFLSSRKVRLHHYLWHQIRDTWNTGIDSEQKKLVEHCGWAPKRAAIDSSSQSIHTEGAGEDFLFMHRQMIESVKEIQVNSCGDLSAISGWSRVPSPTDKDFPVPEPWEVYEAEGFNRFIKSIKTDEYYYCVMREWERTYKDKTWLKGKTLGEIGSKIESTIHNMMHMRWCGRPWDPRTGKKELITGQPDFDLTPKWDSPQADWLGHSYSSHVNPVFWKLHGWVDDRIIDWYEVNKGSSNLKKISLRGVDWYTGDLVLVDEPWSGGMDFGQSNDMDDQMVKHMEKVVSILDGKTKPYQFYEV